MRLISSQEVLVIPILAEHLSRNAPYPTIIVADGILDDLPVRAILDGHHDLFAARWKGIEPHWIVERSYADEALFRVYLAERASTAEHPWYFLDGGKLVEPSAGYKEAVS